jgi:hypothetical protein
MKVLGLDLAGSSKRKTGFAYLEKDKVKVGIIYEDEHILKLSQNFDLKMSTFGIHRLDWLMART